MRRPVIRPNIWPIWTIQIIWPVGYRRYSRKLMKMSPYRYRWAKNMSLPILVYSFARLNQIHWPFTSQWITVLPGIRFSTIPVNVARFSADKTGPLLPKVSIWRESQIISDDYGGFVTVSLMIFDSKRTGTALHWFQPGTDSGWSYCIQYTRKSTISVRFR